MDLSYFTDYVLGYFGGVEPPLGDEHHAADGDLLCGGVSLGFLCPLCRTPARVALGEVWGHEFSLDCSCEHLHEVAVSFLHDDPSTHRPMMLRLLDLKGHVGEVRRLVDDGVSMVIDYGIRILPISRKAANLFVEKHHTHNGKLPGDRFRGGIWNGPSLLGVVIVGNPCARAFNGQAVEVRRLCLDFNVSEALRYKACSVAYGWAASTAESLGWKRIITYILESEAGMSLRYARWKRVGIGKGTGKVWDTPSRRRKPPVSERLLERKVLWEKQLSPKGNDLAL